MFFKNYYFSGYKLLDSLSFSELNLKAAQNFYNNKKDPICSRLINQRKLGSLENMVYFFICLLYLLFLMSLLALHFDLTTNSGKIDIFSLFLKKLSLYFYKAFLAHYESFGVAFETK